MRKLQRVDYSEKTKNEDEDYQPSNSEEEEEDTIPIKKKKKSKGSNKMNKKISYKNNKNNNNSKSQPSANKKLTRQSNEETTIMKKPRREEQNANNNNNNNNFFIPSNESLNPINNPANERRMSLIYHDDEENEDVHIFPRHESALQNFQHVTQTLNEMETTENFRLQLADIEANRRRDVAIYSHNIDAIQNFRKECVRRSMG